jgi:hypothetical protein
VGDDPLNRIGAMLEELGSRFALVVEAVSGFGGRLDRVKEEIFGQFAEVGSQIRFLSDQLAENRAGISAMRKDLGAEMVRLGEALGKTRVEFREQLTATEASLRNDIGSRPVTAAAHNGGDAELRSGIASMSEDIAREMADTVREIKRELAASAESTTKKLGAELKQTNKALATLARKFERFDDRMTVEVRDQDQRLRKVERRGR